MSKLVSPLSGVVSQVLTEDNAVTSSSPLPPPSLDFRKVFGVYTPGPGAWPG